MYRLAIKRTEKTNRRQFGKLTLASPQRYHTAGAAIASSRRFGSVAIPYVERSTIGLFSVFVTTIKLLICLCDRYYINMSFKVSCVLPTSFNVGPNCLVAQLFEEPNFVTDAWEHWQLGLYKIPLEMLVVQNCGDSIPYMFVINICEYWACVMMMMQIAKMDVQQQQHQLTTMTGSEGEAINNSSSAYIRSVVIKLIDVTLTTLAFFLILISTASLVTSHVTATRYTLPLQPQSQVHYRYQVPGISLACQSVYDDVKISRLYHRCA